MNFFEKKLENKKKQPLSTNPVDLYQTLYHKDGYEYLRGIQEEVLLTWNARRDESEILVKMNTGSGKTLVSLMMLYSKMIEGAGTAVYICPDNYLLNQAKNQAILYGIPVCEIEDNNQFPADFVNCKSILLCNFHKLFNAKSIFNRDNIEIGAIVIDDAHSCLDIARQNTTIEINRDHEVFKRLIRLFEVDLKRQAPGSFRGLIEGDPYAKILKVPYWTWFDRKDEILDILSEFSTDKELLLFKWQLVCDSLDSFDCFFGPKGFEISPSIVPFESVKSFSEAKFKYILSATFEDQVDLIKDFGISEKSVIEAIIPKNRKDVGQRLILAPRRFDSTIEDNHIREMCQEIAQQGKNVVVLVPSNDKAKMWIDYGAIKLSGDDITQKIDDLKNSGGGLYVLINRYDGIDLKADMCRLLVIDGYPRFSSYSDLYKELRVESVNASLKSQIIEQGLGRAVRSGSDYCAVILMGNDLVQFLGNKFNYGYFSPITRKQIESGITMLDEETDKSNSLNTVKELIFLCLNQDEGWRKFHTAILDEVNDEDLSEVKRKNLNIAQSEKEALNEFKLGRFNAALNIVDERILKNEKLNLSLKHKSWYFEYAAKLLYNLDPTKSNDLQIQATMSPNMLMPKVGENYSKLNKNEGQASMILSYIRNFNTSQDLKIHIHKVLDDLTFSQDIKAPKFEKALKIVGQLLGFDAQQPEFEYGNGPDVLWIMSDGHYLILEAKSRAIHEEITRENVSQLLHSGEWFKKQYGNNVSHTLVTLQPPNIKGKNVSPGENTKVFDENSLSQLKIKIEQLYNGITQRGFSSINKEDIGKMINNLTLSSASFRETYLKDIKTNRKN